MFIWAAYSRWLSRARLAGGIKECSLWRIASATASFSSRK